MRLVKEDQMDDECTDFTHKLKQTYVQIKIKLRSEAFGNMRYVLVLPQRMPGSIASPAAESSV